MGGNLNINPNSISKNQSGSPNACEKNVNPNSTSESRNTAEAPKRTAPRSQAPVFIAKAAQDAIVNNAKVTITRAEIKQMKAELKRAEERLSILEQEMAAGKISQSEGEAQKADLAKLIKGLSMVLSSVGSKAVDFGETVMNAVKEAPIVKTFLGFFE